MFFFQLLEIKQWCGRMQEGLSLRCFSFEEYPTLGLFSRVYCLLHYNLSGEQHLHAHITSTKSTYSHLRLHKDVSFLAFTLIFSPNSTGGLIRCCFPSFNCPLCFRILGQATWLFKVLYLLRSVHQSWDNGDASICWLYPCFILLLQHIVS